MMSESVAIQDYGTSTIINFGMGKIAVGNVEVENNSLKGVMFREVIEPMPIGEARSEDVYFVEDDRIIVLLFQNVESLDVVIKNLNKIRDDMMKERE